MVGHGLEQDDLSCGAHGITREGCVLGWKTPFQPCRASGLAVYSLMVERAHAEGGLDPSWRL